MQVAHVVDVLEQLAPPSLAAPWDHVGLQIGSSRAPVRKLLLCIDMTCDVVAEARRRRCEMVMAYHPPIFQPLASVTASAQPAIWEALQARLAVYSMHTALDAAPGGTNDVLADVLGLVQPRSLEPADGAAQCKVTVFVPPGELSRVAGAAFAAGAGHIGNYRDCAFFGHGIGTFCGGQGSHPTVGQAGRHEAAEEARLELICPRAELPAVLTAIRSAHSYEEPAIDVYPLVDSFDGRGMGRVGPLARPATVRDLVARIKTAFKLDRVQVATPALSGRVTVGACSAGSAGAMWQAAQRHGAGLYLTGEMRHHDALGAVARGLSVVCVGHGNSERITLGPLGRQIAGHLPALKVLTSQRDRDPLKIV